MNYLELTAELGSMKSYTKRMDYMRQHTKYLGTGSARMTFETQDGKVLKIAKNKKGIAQTEVESALLEDYVLVGLELSIPLVAYEDNTYRWICVEKATKVTEKQFVQHFGLNCFDLVSKTQKFHSNDPNRMNPDFNRLIGCNDNVNNFVNLAGMFDISLIEFSVLGNWGWYNNRIVVLDLGVNKAVKSEFYSFR